MFAVIYRSYLKKGRELEYQQYWEKIARYFVKEKGALGSTLHRADDGMWIAYSRWPNSDARDAAWPKEGMEGSVSLPSEIQQAILGLKDCLDAERKIPEICMNIVKEII